MRQRELEFSKAKEFQASVYDFEARYRNKEDQALSIRKELDEVRFSNTSMQDRMTDARMEFEALSQHCKVLELQNKDLNVELEKFVETDEQIRSTLYRRDRH